MSQFSYFYTNQAEKFAFYRIPQMLFTDERFSKLSTEAKVLYGLMLDRVGLSRKNGLIDTLDRVYIFFTLDEVMECFKCAKEKANKTNYTKSIGKRKFTEQKNPPNKGQANASLWQQA